MTQRLAACLYADVSGYSRLIGADVHSTVRTLTAYRTLMSNIVGKHGGRVVDAAGDSLLAEFFSVTKAVQAAMELQRDLKRYNALLPADRRVEFRVGIDLGEVLAEGRRIYGNCVNTAARVQQIAEPGSVCIAGSAYDRLDGVLSMQFEYLGRKLVKNFDEPLRVYRVE